jgi:hypothetical protein
MDKKLHEVEQTEYTKPRVEDYGDIQELTAQGGGGFTDVPIGNPNSSKSQP